jgi:hypothetical protein
VEGTPPCKTVKGRAAVFFLAEKISAVNFFLLRKKYDPLTVLQGGVFAGQGGLRRAGTPIAPKGVIEK